MMSYPDCLVCGDHGPHRLRHSSEHVELWCCGHCGHDFPVPMATMDSAGDGAPGGDKPREQ